MAKARGKIPTQDDLKRLPRWARVALIARTVRRIQPLYLEAWPKAPRKFQDAIEAAIAEGELAASQGKRTPDLGETGQAAMDVYGKAPDKITFSKEHVQDVPYAASRVSFAGQESDASFAHEGLETAISAVFYFERANRRKGLVKQVDRLIWDDFKLLEAAAKSGKWKGTTPVTPDVFGPMWPDGPPKGWPAMAARPVRAKKARPAKTDLKELRLPKDLVAFLTAGKRLKYNASKAAVGPIELKPLDHLKLTAFEVSTEDTPAQEKDPNRGKRGHYVVRAVDLVAECDAYGPEGILAWLPDYKSFGTWDPDHLQLVVFPKATWSQIEKGPAKYLDAQWGDFEGFARHIEPWKHGTFQKAKR
jgi:hypothetical protein